MKSQKFGGRCDPPPWDGTWLIL